MTVAARDRLALAADLPLVEAQALYQKVAPHVGFAKVGLSLFVEHGPAAVEGFLRLGAKVFLDLKLHDIPNTVELAATHAGELGVSLLTVHASGGSRMLEAAARGAKAGAARRGFAPPRVLAVTVLTSHSDEEAARIGFGSNAAAGAEKLALIAKEAGIDGLVCSPREAQAMRRILGPDFYLCTPGIRPAGAALGDQARAETPAFAIGAGADLLVVGRPIHSAGDPVAAAKAIADEIATAKRE